MFALKYREAFNASKPDIGYQITNLMGIGAELCKNPLSYGSSIIFGSRSIMSIARLVVGLSNIESTASVSINGGDVSCK